MFVPLFTTLDRTQLSSVCRSYQSTAILAEERSDIVDDATRLGVDVYGAEWL